MEIVNSEKFARKFIYFFRPIISRRKRNAMKNYQKENSFREKEIILYASLFYDIARTVYIYTRAFTCRNIPLTTLTFFEGRSRDTERNETKRNKTKQKRNTHTETFTIHFSSLFQVSSHHIFSFNRTNRNK